MTTPHAELKRLAEAATPGPWHAAGGYLTVRDPEGRSFSNTIYHLDEMGQPGPMLAFQAVPFAKSSDAAYIAAANPQAILFLIEENERMREALEECREHLDRFSDVVDGDYGAPEPNEAMQLVHAIDQALGASQ